MSSPSAGYSVKDGGSGSPRSPKAMWRSSQIPDHRHTVSSQNALSPTRSLGDTRSATSPNLYSSSSSTPPVLPPIPRVASNYDSSTSTSRRATDFSGLGLGLGSGIGLGLGLGIQGTEYPASVPERDVTAKAQHEPSPELPIQPSVAAPSISPAAAAAASLSPAAAAAAATVSSSSASTSPSSTYDNTTAFRPPRLSGRSVTSPDGALPRLLSPALTQSQTLGVPYTSTTAQKKPLSGQRPLSASTTINGVPYHEKTSTQRPEMHSHKSSKTKFSLLNPVNLLMRRRSSQAVETLREDKHPHTSLAIPDLPADYDPRIRGKVVHDFSAPKPHRNVSHNDADSPPRLDLPLSGDPFQYSSDSSRPPSAEWDARRRSTQHNPVFVEHIHEDDVASDKRTSAVNAEVLANQDFLARNTRISQDSSILPPFGRKSQQFDDHPAHLPSLGEAKQLSDSPSSTWSEVSPMSNAQKWDARNSIQSPVSPDTLPTLDVHPPVSEEVLDVRVPTPTDSPPMPEMQHLTIDGTADQTSGLPKHLKSTASRFSFQLSGTDSMAEEKILEDKHKLRHSQTVDKSEAPRDDEDDESDYEEEDTFDEDAMYDQDEMEGIGGMQDDIPAANFGAVDGIGRNHNTAILGQPASQLFPQDTPVLETISEQIHPANPFQRIIDQASSGPQMEHLPFDQSQHPREQSALESTTSPKSPNSFYFDDGMIDSIDDFQHEETGFDEDKFDDPSFLKRPNQPQHLSEETRTRSENSSIYDVNGYTFLMHNAKPGNIAADSPFSEDSADQGDSNGQQKEENFRHDSQDPFDARNGLSAYHSALADAANKAAANGKFSRQHSVDGDSQSAYSDEPASGPVLEESFLPIQGHSRMMSASTHQSHPSYSGFDFGFNSSPTLDDTFSSPEFPSDDYSFDDLDMVAEANAEALAHDEDGFYSQEFGFYGRPRSDSDTDSTEAFAGGYFGAPGIEIVRQKSLREPNLTPITERSEFSARNSFISAGMGPFTSMAAALPASPGFPPQIARAMSPLAWGQMQEDDMTLADLRRLRANAFGSSSTSSLRSDGAGSAAGHNYNPIVPAQGSGGHFLPPNIGGVPMAYQYSNESSGSGYGSGYSQSPIASSPAIAMQMPMQMSSPTQILTHPLQAPPQLSSPVQSQANAFAMFNDDNDPTPRKSSSPLTQQRQQQDPLSTPVKKSSSSPAYSQQMQDLPSTPPTAVKIKEQIPNKPAYKTHSRTGSGADSVTYVREDDDNGKKRWVIERRRTSEQGVLELVGREILENGRI